MTESQNKNAFYQKHKLDPSDEQFGNMMCSAVRYALGRMTYIACDTVEYIERYIHDMDSHALRIIADEIKRNAEWNNIGMTIDRVKWLHLRNEILNELKSRDEKN